MVEEDQGPGEEIEEGAKEKEVGGELELIPFQGIDLTVEAME